jgi:uncharacterized membrane protein
MSKPLNGEVAVATPSKARARSVTGNHAVSNRLAGIDAARGIAMILVCVSHVRHHFRDFDAVYALLTAITRIATPTFLLLSGFVAAHVLTSGKPGARIAIVDRALFVLIAGHLLLNVEELRLVPLGQWLLERVTVTDAIGVSLAMSALLVWLPSRVLTLLGMFLALISWPIARMLTADANLGGYVLTALFDVRSNHGSLVDAAIVPYLGVFLVGMGLSKGSLSLLVTRNHAALARKFVRVAVTAIVTCAVLALLARSFKDPIAHALGTPLSTLLLQGLNPMQKLPPSPAYLGSYGSAALLIAAACLASRPQMLVRPIVNWSATIGRASLLCFVLQDWMLKMIPIVLGFESTRSVAFWMVYLVVTVLALYLAASKWSAHGANRLLSVGLKSWAEGKRAQRSRSDPKRVDLLPITARPTIPPSPQSSSPP